MRTAWGTTLEDGMKTYWIYNHTIKIAKDVADKKILARAGYTQIPRSLYREIKRRVRELDALAKYDGNDFDEAIKHGKTYPPLT